MARPVPIDFQSGWPHIQAAIQKLEEALENGTETNKTKGKSKLFPNSTYMDIYTCVLLASHRRLCCRVWVDRRSVPRGFS